MIISDIKAYRVNFEINKSRRIYYKNFNKIENIFVIIETNENLIGIGESTPIKSITGDSKKTALRLLSLAKTKLKGCNPCDIDSIHEILENTSLKSRIISNTAINAIDSACYDLLGKSKKKPTYQVLRKCRMKNVLNTVTIYLGSFENTMNETIDIMMKYRRCGIKRIKLKLSGQTRIDKKRVMGVTKLFSGDLTLDANEAYRNERIAVKIFNSIYDLVGDRILLIEQPSPRRDLEKLRYITERSKIPIFADESTANLQDLYRILASNTVNGINIKLQRAGGIHWGNKMFKLAKKNKLEVMVGSIQESGVGVSQDVNFLASISDYVIGSDIDTDLDLEKDIVTKSSKIPFKNGGRLPLKNHGLGVKIKNSVKSLMTSTSKIDVD
ncbi:mandelate racemase/muconate lactonizing enzyme family protein [[Eubacterium] cellulosolvens]